MLSTVHACHSSCNFSLPQYIGICSCACREKHMKEIGKSKKAAHSRHCSSCLLLPSPPGCSRGVTRLSWPSLPKKRGDHTWSAGCLHSCHIPATNHTAAGPQRQALSLSCDRPGQLQLQGQTALPAFVVVLTALGGLLWWTKRSQRPRKGGSGSSSGRRSKFEFPRGKRQVCRADAHPL